MNKRTHPLYQRNEKESIKREEEKNKKKKIGHTAKLR